ncbi:type II toxin-antitoxin system PemK/MazF family toxin [Aerococcaceae bacterium zg-ZJ1578]|uniref:type II toxin-antitoxin system PemK/MazF family toxin n=1 Tax=Aerococcaceae bacterium zg-252 TaxID=2796928 RepID=UPI001A1DA754|nr:type II toxin-antitoxin system PemK/MazF family toxin [Aerococcaceae bacterium zg-1578]
MQTKIPYGWEHINMEYEATKIDIAATKYKRAFFHRISKFKYLPDYLLKQAYNFEQCHSHKIFDKYKRGTLVYVEFGINWGCELSGNHFALTLDNIDKKSKQTITVIPLSSKNKKYYSKLSVNLYEVSQHYIANEILKLSKKEMVQYSSQIDKIKKRYQRYNAAYSYACINMIQTISKEKITKINRFDPSGNTIVSTHIMNYIDEALKREYLAH